MIKMEDGLPSLELVSKNLNYLITSSHLHVFTSSSLSTNQHGRLYEMRFVIGKEKGRGGTGSKDTIGRRGSGKGVECISDGSGGTKLRKGAAGKGRA